MTTISTPYRRDQRFFTILALGTALFIFLSFAQWSARGMVNFRTEPVWAYLHGMTFFAWLALFVAQNRLAERGSLVLHRRLGWTGLGLAVLMVVLGCFTALRSIELHRVPPFFSNTYFLSLSVFDVAAFAILIAAGIVLRRQTQWHRRLMFGATVMLMEPALGRVIPATFFMAPLPWAWLGTYGNLCQRLAQLAVLAIAMRHDKLTLGAVHPALKWSAAILLVGYQLVIMGEHFQPLVRMVAAIAGG